MEATQETLDSFIFRHSLAEIHKLAASTRVMLFLDVYGGGFRIINYSLSDSKGYGVGKQLGLRVCARCRTRRCDFRESWQLQ